MSLSEQIKSQYNNRKSNPNLYGNNPYSNAVQKEIKDGIEDLLKKYFKNFDELSLLEIGAGNGTNAYIFEDLGFQRKNISFNELLEERVTAIKNNFPENQLFIGDATNINTTQKFDVIFQSTVFTSILKEESRIKLANKMWELLKPNGVILWYDFIYNNPANADVKKVTIKEVKALFKGAKLFDIKHVTLAPPIGRKVGKYYNFFNFTFLRSHILAIIQK
ncbi:MAG: methyltransferase domain-containing protein [Bacteroidota bacterium]|nr:methyltransferase domain-containing protein [Bacteroidota bacterium]MDP3146600.1 methyltransferase domain-containing protein [Bacteroidota bacterium]